jgi:hypothetical protein
VNIEGPCSLKLVFKLKTKAERAFTAKEFTFSRNGFKRSIIIFAWGRIATSASKIIERKN